MNIFLIRVLHVVSINSLQSVERSLIHSNLIQLPLLCTCSTNNKFNWSDRSRIFAQNIIEIYLNWIKPKVSISQLLLCSLACALLSFSIYFSINREAINQRPAICNQEAGGWHFKFSARAGSDIESWLNLWQRREEARLWIRLSLSPLSHYLSRCHYLSHKSW